MPTGYTAKLMEEGQTFQEFTLQCARAFGALIMMRDDPADAPIPDKFDPSDYSKKRLLEHQSEFVRLVGLSMSERESFGNFQKAEAIDSANKWLAKDKAQNARLAAMEATVKAWTPPTADHNGLKAFMLEQINTSKNDTDYIVRMIEEARSKRAIDFYKGAVESAERSIQYSTKDAAEEIERANSRTEWVKQLRASIQ